MSRTSNKTALKKIAQAVLGAMLVPGGGAPAVSFAQAQPSTQPAAATTSEASTKATDVVAEGLGPDGKVAIFNYAGDTDIVADVMGYFTT